jgi:hypothetical protein
MNKTLFPECKKIILTTDQELIKDGVQSIDDEFLEWFVKNPSCEYIQTTELSLFNGDTGQSGHYKYEIIIPQEEPSMGLKLEDYYIGKKLKLKKKLPSRCYKTTLRESETIKIDKFIDGEVKGCRVAIGYKYGLEFLLFNTVYAESYLEDMFELIDDSLIPAEPKHEKRKICKCKRAYENPLSEICSLCWNELYPNEKDEIKEEDLIESKQETLEEAAENNYPKGDVWDTEQALIRRLAFINGAKYQQEQAKKMYSEEEVIQIVLDLRFKVELYSTREEINEWFEQFFKKK